ncbi:MAG: hypothetical protein CL773_00880 [Chloroflexi bacterium]|nr:hypothetical protein [Chloroflexota bacterium]|tara:strand:- start:1125 stop:2450 length:1326 start_codon:yes stop_codon:yes gene_type:complete
MNDINNSKKLYTKAKKYIAGGISSQIRALEHSEVPLFIQNAKGSKIWDVDGNEYIDYIQGMGPNIFGHAPDFINQRVSKEIKNGMVYAAQFDKEIEVAEKSLEILNVRDWTVRFASSGTEIDQLLIRLMRGYTNRQLFVKFEGHYHGWMDSINYSVHPDLELAGDNSSPEAVPESKGMDENTKNSVIIARWNDIDHLKEIFQKYGDEIAGVLMEPILANTNCIIPDKGYIQSVKKLCHDNGSLMAFDEVITGFRILKGSAKEYFGVTPDLATFAKSFAGGFPIAMLAGKREIMNFIGDGTVYHGGSFNSNVASIAAANASLDEMIKGKNFFYNLEKKGQKLIQGIKDLSDDLDIDIHAQGLGSVFSISFTEKEHIRDWRDHFRNCDENKYKSFCEIAFKKGIRLSSNGRVHLSTSHTENDIEKTLEMFKLSLIELKQKLAG